MRTTFRLLPFFLYAIGLIWVVRNDPFFWDTVQLGSKHAHFFYENGLHWAPLPEQIDSGHPPTLGFYLALIWTIFGKTLPSSHWAMLPFLLGIIYLLYRIGTRLTNERQALWLLPMVLLDPVFAGQSVLISPDLILAFWFLLALEGLWGNKRWFVVFGFLGLCSISMRGMMTAGALFFTPPLTPPPGGRGIWSWYFELIIRTLTKIHIEIKGIFQTFIKYQKGNQRKSIPLSTVANIPEKYQDQIPLPFAGGVRGGVGFLFAAIFLLWHYRTTGWVGFHPGSPWAPAFEKVGVSGVLRNIAVLSWRWLDFGRFVEFLSLAWLIWMYRRGQINGPSKTVLSLLICLLVFLLPSAIIHRNLSAHRYFLPAFMALHLLVFQWLSHIRRARIVQNTIFAGIVFILATGNLWIYPRGISMDWDSTLAHQPYHRLRAEAMEFLEKGRIDFNTVGTSFPNLNTGEMLSLNGDERCFVEKDFEHNAYIFASNIYNDFSASDYTRLQEDWVLIKRFEQAGVFIEIYKRKS